MKLFINAAVNSRPQNSLLTVAFTVYADRSTLPHNSVSVYIEEEYMLLLRVLLRVCLSVCLFVSKTRNS